MGQYLRPTSVDAALRALGAARLTIIAGGTDIYPARVGRPLADDILDLSAVAGLGGIAEGADAWRIGAGTTWSELIAADLPALFDGLKLAAREVGGAQIQNAGTLAGNLCNASPAADGVPPLKRRLPPAAAASFACATVSSSRTFATTIPKGSRARRCAMPPQLHDPTDTEHSPQGVAGAGRLFRPYISEYPDSIGADRGQHGPIHTHHARYHHRGDLHDYRDLRRAGVRELHDADGARLRYAIYGRSPDHAALCTPSSALP